MKDTFLREKEAGAHLHAGCAHEQRGGNAAAVYDAARRDDRDLYFGDDIFHESHGRQFAVMAAGFHALDDKGVCAFVLHARGELRIGHDGNTFDAVRLQRFKIRNRISCADRDKRQFFITDELRHIIFIGGLQHQINAKRLIRHIFRAADLFADSVNISAARGNDACAAGMADGCYEIGLREVGHSALDDRVVDSKKFSDFGFPHTGASFVSNNQLYDFFIQKHISIPYLHYMGFYGGCKAEKRIRKRLSLF